MDRSNARSLTVGLSGNAVDRSLHAGGLDGIGVYTLSLERALRKAGVVTLRVGARAGPSLRAPGDADFRVSLPLVPAMVWSALLKRPAPFSDAIARRIDIYHCTDYRIPKLGRTPVVATLYDAIPLAHPEWASQRLRRAKNWLLRSAALNAQRVIAISHAAVNDIVEHYGVERERVRVVHPGVEDTWLDGAPPDAQAALHRFRLEPGHLLYVGTLQPRKNVGALLDAYDRLPDAVRSRHRLVIVGKYGWGVDTLRAELEARRSKAEEVLWLEYVPHDVLRALYATASALVFPSLAEGFGLPILEALASGLPVVALDIPVVHEVAGPHAILAAPGDVDALALAIMTALAAPRDAEADRLRMDWARRFDWDTCAARTIEVYRECAGS